MFKCTLLLLLLISVSVNAWSIARVKKIAFVSAASAGLISSLPLDALAVSGGGKDYATKDLKGDISFSGADNKGKDFTQVDAKGVNFANAQLQGSRFYRGFLESANFNSADLTSASLEDAGLEKADFTNAILVSSYLSSSFEQVASIKGADFSDALLPEKTIKVLCARTDAAGVNSKTGVETRDSLMCP